MKLEINNLSKIFDDKHVLKSIALKKLDFQSIVIVGPSGGGKSTLLRLIGGLILPDEGNIIINGQKIPVTEKDLHEYRKKIGYVFQGYNLFPHLTALQNITLPLEKVHGLSFKDAMEKAIYHLERFKLLDHKDKFPHQLSGGQQQRVAIVRSVSKEPEFLLFDEPTSALDPEFTSEVLDVIEDLKEEGKNIILVTHEMGFAKIAADYAFYIDDGNLAEWGKTSDFFTSPVTPSLRKFLDKVLKYE